MSNLDLKDDEHEDGKGSNTEDAPVASPAPTADEGPSDKARVQSARVEHTQPPAATTQGTASTHASTATPRPTPELASSASSDAERSIIDDVRFTKRSTTVPPQGNTLETAVHLVFREPKVRKGVRRATHPPTSTASHTAHAATDFASGSTTHPPLDDGSEA